MGKRGPKRQYPHDLWVQFTDEQQRWLRREAALMGTSMNQIVRTAVDAYRAKKDAS